MRRAIAFGIDFSLVGLALLLLLELISDNNASITWVPVLVLPILYEGLFVQQTGQTIGKSMLGIEVVSRNGDPASDGQAWMRAAGKVAQLTCCGLAFLSAVLSRDRRGLHDYLAGTRVIRTTERHLLKTDG